MRCLILILTLCLVVGTDQPDTPLPTPVRPATAPQVRDDKPLPSQEEFVKLAQTDPIQCLRASLQKYEAEIHGLHGIMDKQERVGKRANPAEEVEFWFKDKPHSVLLVWKSKPAGLADRVLFVEGANNGQMLAHPATRLMRMAAGDVVAKDPESKEAKSSSRVTVNEFGLRKALERNYVVCEEQRKAGKFKLEYLGVKEIPELKNRSVHMFRRTNDEPEGFEKITKFEFGLDKETWMQTVSHVYGQSGDLIGRYFFREIEVNPKFADDQFDQAQLTK